MQQKVKWFLAPGLAIGRDLDQKLRGYTQCMNFVLAKNTKNQLIYDGFDVVLSSPYNSIIYDDQPKPSPTQFDLWIYLNHKPNRTSGFSTYHIDGTGVLDCDFDHLSDPENPDSNFDNQMYILLHEYAHNFNAGIGEYYKTARIPDATGQDPILDVDILNPEDRYWVKHKDFYFDPLLRNHTPWTELRFSELTAAIINSQKYRLGNKTVDVAHPDQVIINAYDANWNKLNNVKIDVYRGLKGAIEQYSTVYTNLNGQAVLSWSCSLNEMTNDPARMVKFYKQGYLSGATHFTLWDHQFAAVCRNKSKVEISIFLLKTAEEMTDELMDKITDLDECAGWSIDTKIRPVMFPKKFKKLKASRLAISNLDENLIQANILRCQKNH